MISLNIFKKIYNYRNRQIHEHDVFFFLSSFDKDLRKNYLENRKRVNNTSRKRIDYPRFLSTVLIKFSIGNIDISLKFLVLRNFIISDILRMEKLNLFKNKLESIFKLLYEKPRAREYKLLKLEELEI